MSNLRDSYDHSAVSNRIIQPPLADLQDRARRRARRHRATGGLAVAVLVALVAVPLLTLPGGGSGMPAEPGSPSPELSYGMSMSFHDLDHGYAAFQIDPGCVGRLSVTQDGGSTWSELRDLPGSFRAPPFRGDPACFSAHLIPLEARTLVLPGSPETLPRVGTPSGFDWADPPAHAFISHDAGVTWQEYRPEFRTADVVPPGVTPEARCRDLDCAEVSLGWYDRQSGNPTVLRNMPPAAAAGGHAVGVAVAADDSIWVTGIGPDRDRLVSISRDRGRTWQTNPLPETGDQAGDPGGDQTGDPGGDQAGDAAGTPDDPGTRVASADGATGYVWARDASGAGESVLYRTTDAGQTWHRVTGAPPLRGLQGMWVSPDGTLGVVDAAGWTRVSTDGGATFRATDLPMLNVEPIVGGFLGYAQDGSVGPLSTDSLTWRPVRIPRP